jgi:hypothetical protein
MKSERQIESKARFARQLGRQALINFCCLGIAMREHRLLGALGLSGEVLLIGVRLRRNR